MSISHEVLKFFNKKDNRNLSYYICNNYDHNKIEKIILQNIILARIMVYYQNIIIAER